MTKTDTCKIPESVLKMRKNNSLGKSKLSKKCVTTANLLVRAACPGHLILLDVVTQKNDLT
jgi:hypothetical protein